jgi:hypothetical protein
MYELCFRAVQGLPLPARDLTNLLLQSIIARLLRAQDVVVCNFVWMSNHQHMQLYCLDAEGMKRFHGGLKKRITDFIKRLRGIPQLSLWEEGDSMGEILDLNAAIERFVYTFLNPVRARKCSSIDTYKGFNSWHEFLSAPADVNACVEKEIPWIFATDIEPLSQENPSRSEEQRVVADITAKAALRTTHTLRIHPFKWLQAFNITHPKAIEAIRQRIIHRVRQEEAELLGQKLYDSQLEGFVVSDDYLPPPKERRLFMYGSTRRVRQRHLVVYDRFVRECRKCYQLMKTGAKNIPWPPACFVPPAPRLCNAL